jgi:hypothetical protein
MASFLLVAGKDIPYNKGYKRAFGTIIKIGDQEKAEYWLKKRGAEKNPLQDRGFPHTN